MNDAVWANKTTLEASTVGNAKPKAVFPFRDFIVPEHQPLFCRDGLSQILSGEVRPPVVAAVRIADVKHRITKLTRPSLRASSSRRFKRCIGL
jgi:hypothetical protein